jgi:hypothetical protein
MILRMTWIVPTASSPLASALLSELTWQGGPYYGQQLDQGAERSARLGKGPHSVRWMNLLRLSPRFAVLTLIQPCSIRAK